MKNPATLPGRILWNAFFWTYERATWQYDAMVVAILAFVWLTPPDWLTNTRSRTSAAWAVLVAVSRPRTADELRTVTANPRRRAERDMGVPFGGGGDGAGRVPVRHPDPPGSVTRSIVSGPAASDIRGRYPSTFVRAPPHP